MILDGKISRSTIQVDDCHDDHLNGNDNDSMISLVEKDYVDQSLFSPEISRHALDTAHRRARDLVHELQEAHQSLDDDNDDSDMIPCPAHHRNRKRASHEDSSWIHRMVTFVTTRGRRNMLSDDEYELLPKQPSPASNLDILDFEDAEDQDRDVDALEFAADDRNRRQDHHSKEDSNTGLVRSSRGDLVLSALKGSSKKENLRISWNPGNLQQRTVSLASDEDLGLDDDLSDDKELFIRRTQDQAQRQKSLPGLRRLTKAEKNALHQTRPDLNINPNWAQKYREELKRERGSAQGRSFTKWCLWFVMSILFCGVLFCTVLLIERQLDDASSHDQTLVRRTNTSTISSHSHQTTRTRKALNDRTSISPSHKPILII